MCLFDRRMYNGRTITPTSINTPSGNTPNSSVPIKTSKHTIHQPHQHHKQQQQQQQQQRQHQHQQHHQQQRPFGGEYLRITTGQPNEIHTRNFWITPDESTVIAPYQHTTTIEGTDKHGASQRSNNSLDFSKQSGLALWNIKQHMGSSNNGPQCPPTVDPQLLFFSSIPHILKNDTLDGHGNITVCPNHQWSKYYQQHSGSNDDDDDDDDDCYLTHLIRHRI